MAMTEEQKNGELPPTQLTAEDVQGILMQNLILSKRVRELEDRLKQIVKSNG